MARMIDADALYNGTMKDEYFRFKETDKTGREAFAYSCAMERLVEAPTVGGWISVKDRLPDEKENWITKDYQKVICCCDFGGDPKCIDVRTYGFGNGHFWHGPQIMDWVVTHWMPLPEPPKEDEDDAEQ